MAQRTQKCTAFVINFYHENTKYTDPKSHKYTIPMPKTSRTPIKTPSTPNKIPSTQVHNLSQIYALFSVLFTGLNNAVTYLPKVTNSRYEC